MRTRPGIRPRHDPRDGLPTISNPFPGPWHDPLLIRTTLIEKDIIGLNPFTNWITPLDFIPGVGAYAKGAKGVKGFSSAGKLYQFGLGHFAALKGLESSIEFIGILSKIYNMSLSDEQSPRQDVTSATSAGQTPKTRGGTKSSRGAKSPQTLKPFWSNGKPKCRKGYRYDFKRKMCVRKS